MQDTLYKTYEFFRLFHSEPPASPGSNLMQVLNQHADTLQHHRLQHTNILNGSSSRNGEELASSEGLDAARAYVQHSGSSLTSLGLTHCSFTLHDLGMLLDRLWQGSSENTEGGGLRSLNITVQVLSPQVQDMLVEKLQQLERMKVGFANSRSNNSTDVMTWTGEGSKAGLGDLTHGVQPCVL